MFLQGSKDSPTGSLRQRSRTTKNGTTLPTYFLPAFIKENDKGAVFGDNATSVKKGDSSSAKHYLKHCIN